jgi:hypothetical protein
MRKHPFDGVFRKRYRMGCFASALDSAAQRAHPARRESSVAARCAAAATSGNRLRLFSRRNKETARFAFALAARRCARSRRATRWTSPLAAMWTGSVPPATHTDP